MPTLNACIKKGRKYDQVLDGARTVFLRDGYEGASVDDIAREACVSKATLYSYFPDKRLLFMEVARHECARQADAAVELTDMTAPPRDVLTAAARRITGFSTSDFGQRMFRVCVAESDRFPELGRAFYDSGPLLVRRRLADYMRTAAARGDLVIPDIDLAADQFAELCKAGIHAKLIFGAAACSKEDIERTIEGAVDMFLARYGARAA
ncbi:MAG: TetR/AcrR family transcriptional regulator [Paracoccaceae bacterium]|nr:TetR/AcrR family transcriptional regulator [Paracoccaceae bacterium]